MNMLRTNLEIDQDLLINAMELCDAKTVSEIIENALKELIQTRKQVNLMDIRCGCLFDSFVWGLYEIAAVRGKEASA